MLLSQHKNKSSSKKNTNTSSIASSSCASTSSYSEDFGSIHSSTASFLTLHVYSGKQGRVIGTIEREALLRTAYTDNPHTLVRFYVPPGVHSFALVLSQWEQRHNIDYTLAVFSMVPCALDVMPDILKPKLHMPFYFLTSRSAAAVATTVATTAADATVGTMKIEENQYQVVVQWELIFSNPGESMTSCMLYLEEASDDRIASYPLHVHTSPVLNWSSTTNSTSIERFLQENERQEEEEKVAHKIGMTEEEKKHEDSNTASGSAMIRLELYQISQLSQQQQQRLGSTDSPDRTLVGSSGDFRPRFCYVESRNIVTKRRHLVVASYMTTDRKESELSRRFVLRLGLSKGRDFVNMFSFDATFFFCITN